ncbi:MAG: HNH endonuclease signature motif containing protein, partial [Pseudonocardiaceae bacterium]
MSTAQVWQSSDAELLAELGALETRLHSTWAEMLSVVAEIDSRGTAVAAGYGTTAELIRAVARVPRGEARARVAAAADVLPGRG